MSALCHEWAGYFTLGRCPNPVPAGLSWALPTLLAAALIYCFVALKAAATPYLWLGFQDALRSEENRKRAKAGVRLIPEPRWGSDLSLFVEIAFTPW